MAVVRLYPVSDFNSIAEEFDRALTHFMGTAQNERSSNGEDYHWHPRADVREIKESFVLTFELPGVDKDDIHIQYEGGLLKVEGERKQLETPEATRNLREERRFGKFSRAFKLNAKVQVDKIEAEFKNGLLTVIVPKAEEVKPKDIKIKVGK